MTAAEHAAAAIAALKATKVSYLEWCWKRDKGLYPDITKTMWWQALDHLGHITDAQESRAVAAPGSTGFPVTTIPYTSGIALNVQASGVSRQDIAIDDGTGDSAILVGSGGKFVSNVTLQRIRVTGAAKGNAVSWGKHGAYLDCHDSLLEDIDIQGSQFCSSGLSVRMGGMVIRRVAVSGCTFPIAFFDSDTGQSDGTVLCEDIAGVSSADTAIWCDAQDDFKTTFDLKLTFRRCHMTGPPAFLKANRVRNGRFRFEGCTLNGQPVVASQVPPGSVIV